MPTQYMCQQIKLVSTNICRRSDSPMTNIMDRARSRSIPVVCLGVRPLDIQVIGTDLAIKWSEGEESFISLQQLRHQCPCAACKGETDIMGNVYKGANPTLGPESFRLASIQQVGGYAIQPVWADGHATGLYSFDYLRRISSD